MRKHLIVLGILGLVLMTGLQAQRAPYKFGIGFRAGLYLGLTGKYNFSDRSAIEFMAETRRKGFIFTPLYEYHFALGRDGAIRPYIGAGGHFGLSGAAFLGQGAPKDHYVAMYGLDGIVGIEYTFDQLPINISIDFKPVFNYWDTWRVYTDNFGVAIRYVFQ